MFNIEQALADPWWRLTSGKLYKIMIKGDDGEDGLVVPFIPNGPQRHFLENLHYRNIILKARQLGFTTAIDLYFLDCALFRNNIRAGIIAQNEDAAKTIFRDKVKFAYDNLPEELRMVMPLQRDSQSELLFAHNNSSVRVGTSMRSGTIHYLHVSEFGKICAEFPNRAKEVITGSIPAVPQNGLVCIESTAEGQEGEFFKMCDRSQKLALEGKKLNKKDYRFHFYAWWKEARYKTSESVVITKEDHEYFDSVEVQMECKLSQEQRAWYCLTRDADFSGEDEKMWQEYPSTPKEAFQKSVEGCFYHVQMTKVRKDGRITKVPYQQGYPVNTYWDIGSGDGTAIWLHQEIGQKHNFIGYIEAWGEPYSYFVSELQKFGYVWGQHYLPHDGNHVRQDTNINLSPRQKLEALGLRNIEIVDRVADISHGIQQTRDMLGSCWFDEENCKNGIIHLDMYRKTYSKTKAMYIDTPLHDEHSEGADAFRQFAQGYKEKRTLNQLPKMRGWGQ